MRSRRTAWRVPTAAATLVLSLAACSASGGGAESTPAAPATSTPVAGDTEAAEGTATLTITDSGLEELDDSWTLDGQSGDVSPTDELIAGVWADTIDNVAAGYGDLIVVSVGGTIVEGTQTTSDAGVGIGFSVSRIDAAGSDVFNHNFSSRDGECEVTMARTSTGVSGSFTCTGITDEDGHTVNATGTFAH